jgi:hypothetical protein
MLARPLLLRSAPLGVLLALVLAATWELAIAGRIVARGDLLLYFYPLRDFAAATLREGRLPLWNPYSFMGAQFLANPQTAVFYPPNVLLSWLPVERAVSLNIVLHLMIAALGAFILARRGMPLSRIAALCTGIAFGLGGYLGAQIEHLNQVQALAWMPFVLTAVLTPIDSLRGCLRRAAQLAVLLALQITAGHTQSLYISCVAAGVVALLHGIRAKGSPSPSSRASPLFPIFALALAVFVAALICGAQLLPTLELSRDSFRAGGMSLQEAGAFSWRPWVIARALMPTWGDPLFAEYVGYIGAMGIALAALGALTPLRKSLLPLALTIGGGVLALGIATPLFTLLYRFAPGFNLFRAQARWLAVFALGAALLIGLGIQALQNGLDARAKKRWRIAWSALVVVLTAGAVLGARFSPEVEYATLPARSVLLAWASAIVAASAMVFGSGRIARIGAPLAAALLIVELLAASQSQPYSRTTDAGTLTSLRPAVAHLLAERGESEGRVLALSGLFFDPGDKPEQELLFARSLSADEIYDRLIASKHKEILSPNLSLLHRLPSVDGYDGGLLPTRRFVEFTQQFAADASKDGRLREFLKSVPATQWLNAMNVRYVVADKTQDVFVDGVFYDLLWTTPLTSVRDVSLQPYDATALGMVFGLPNARSGELIGELELHFAAERIERFALRVPPNAPSDGFQLTLRWGDAAAPLFVRFTPSDERRGLVLRGITSIDERDGSFLSQIASADALVRLVHSGDVKIYRIAGDAAARALLRNAPLTPITVRDDSPERVFVEWPQALRDADMLVLRDACAPGWTARVKLGDGVMRESPIECVDVMFRGVRVPAGARSIEFVYAPESLRVGALLSALGALAWLALLAAGLRQTSKRMPNTTPSMGMR